MPFDADEVEASLTRYYDLEGEERVGRPLDPRREALRERLLDEVRGRRRQLLEVGAGPGRDAAAVVAAGHQVTAVDLSREHAKRCRAHGTGVVLATVRALPFPDGIFDAVWTMSVLMHVPDTAIAIALREVRRVLALGSAAYIGVWGGADVEEMASAPPGRDDLPPRLFSRRSNTRWRELLAIVGTIEHYDYWAGEPANFGYQVAVVRRT